MVEFDKSKNEVRVILPQSDANDIAALQEALIDLITDYNYAEYAECSKETFYWALKLLKGLLPTYDQLKKGLTSESNSIEIPENINERQKEAIREAFYMLEHPEIKQQNIILEAIKKVTV